MRPVALNSWPSCEAALKSHLLPRELEIYISRVEWAVKPLPSSLAATVEDVTIKMSFSLNCRHRSIANVTKVFLVPYGPCKKKKVAIKNVFRLLCCQKFRLILAAEFCLLL